MRLNLKSYKTLDLGCGKNKHSGAFGVDFTLNGHANMAWNLNKPLPVAFNNHFEKVVHNCVLDHIGNPYAFLKGCYSYLKKGGMLEIAIDNADYWRSHFNLGNYHADIWEKDDPLHPETHHKMMFQMKHIEKMLKLIGFKIIKKEYFRDYKGILRGHIDFILPSRLGCNMMRIVAVKPKSI
jgi:predicted SAM-dependent methyltransferase